MQDRVPRPLNRTKSSSYRKSASRTRQIGHPRSTEDISLENLNIRQKQEDTRSRRHRSASRDRDRSKSKPQASAIEKLKGGKTYREASPHLLVSIQGKNTGSFERLHQRGEITARGESARKRDQREPDRVRRVAENHRPGVNKERIGMKGKKSQGLGTAFGREAAELDIDDEPIELHDLSHLGIDEHQLISPKAPELRRRRNPMVRNRRFPEPLSQKTLFYAAGMIFASVLGVACLSIFVVAVVML